MKTRSIVQFSAIVLVLIFIGWYFSNILWYLIISLVFSTILKPLTNYLAKVHFFGVRLPRFIAVLASFFALVGFLFVFVVIFIPLISDQVQVLSSLNYDDIFSEISGPVKSIEEFLIVNELTAEEEGFITEQIWEATKAFWQGLDIRTLLNNILGLATGFFIGLLAVIFITFMLLYEKGLLKRSIMSLVPNRYFEIFITVISKIERLMSNYLLGLLFQMVSIFSLAAIGLTIVGIKYALTIALFAAVANLIPYAGPIIGATFGLIVGLSTGNVDFTSNQYLFFMLKIISVFSLVQLVDNLVLQPLIFSKSVKAHPLEIFVVIFAGATIAGIVGMIVAIPAYTILRVFALELYSSYKTYHIFRT